MELIDFESKKILFLPVLSSFLLFQATESFLYFNVGMLYALSLAFYRSATVREIDTEVTGQLGEKFHELSSNASESLVMKILVGLSFVMCGVGFLFLQITLVWQFVWQSTSFSSGFLMSALFLDIAATFYLLGDLLWLFLSGIVGIRGENDSNAEKTELVEAMKEMED